ncbi:MAG: TIGR04053 family radical SAM/SPASM domain-containing protein [Acidobacteriota bacterium]
MVQPAPSIEAVGGEYADHPFILIWELSQACELACRHCRAEAIPGRHPGELSTEEGKTLLDAAAEMGVFVVVLTGGDPLERDDLYELIGHGVDAGLRMSTIPAATSNLSRATVAKLRDAGLAQMALSLDAPTSAAHDAFRGVEGVFAKTLEAAGWAREIGLPLQINSVICRQTWPAFDELAKLVAALGPVFWEVFFLVPVGRGVEIQSLSADEYEEAFAKIHSFARGASFIVKVAEAPHYHRYCLQHHGAGGASRRGNGGAAHPMHGHGPRSAMGLGRGGVVPGAVGRAPAPVNAGKGFCFVSHLGEVFPSGFMPLSAGNVRNRSLQEIYRQSDLFRRLRDPDELEGKCGICRFRPVCGGSRSRAFALTGNPLASEPCCAYEPAGT